MRALQSCGDKQSAGSLPLAEIVAARELLGDRVLTTPVIQWGGPQADNVIGSGAVFLKLELLQHAGSFKTRAAFLHCLALEPEQRRRGVCAVSAGNHAVAVAYVARELGIGAKIVLFKSANPQRVNLCRHYGAEIVIADSPHAAFDIAGGIVSDEGRTLIHPFEGRRTALGTATVGLELCDQVESLDAVIVPIGGGGLAAGVASAVRCRWPKCEVFGVEPVGAASMHASFAANEPRGLEEIKTIADSLGPPRAEPISFALCHANLNSVQLVHDDSLRSAMRVLLADARLAVEPAAAAALACLMGPLKQRLHGARVGLIVCGTNIDPDSYIRLLA